MVKSLCLRLLTTQDFQVNDFQWNYQSSMSGASWKNTENKWAKYVSLMSVTESANVGECVIKWCPWGQKEFNFSDAAYPAPMRTPLLKEIV